MFRFLLGAGPGRMRSCHVRRRARRNARGRLRASAPAFAKPAGDLFKGRQQRAFFDLDLSHPGLQRDAPDALGLPRFSLLQLILKPSDFVPDPGFPAGASRKADRKGLPE
ncbi:hypothetical protein ACVJGD_000120 [Bradyrhizobium sp. USDA 10063]